MQELLKTLLVALVFISISSCSAIAVVSNNKASVELRRINADIEIKQYELNLKYNVNNE